MGAGIQNCSRVRTMKSQDLSTRTEHVLSKIKLNPDEKNIACILERQGIGIYCRNFVSGELESLVINMLGKCKKFDLRSREQKPSMAKARKRLILGASQVANQIELGKISAIIVATDIDDESLLNDHLKACIQSNVLTLYCCKRRQLASLLLSPSAKISVVGIRHFDGVEDDWKSISRLSSSLQNEWSKAMAESKSYVNGMGESWIWLCAYYGHVFDHVQDESVPFVNSIHPRNGMSPLAVAVLRNHIEVARALLKANADQLIPDFGLCYPLHYAQSCEMASLLDYHEKRNASGLTALEYSVFHGIVAVAMVYIKKAMSVQFLNLLFLSSHCKNTEMFEFVLSQSLLRKDVLLSAVDENDNTLLMRAVREDSYEVFKFVGNLLGWEHVDLRKTNSSGQTILDIASKTQNSGILRKLEKIRRESQQDV